MKIADLEKQSGVGRSTIHHYLNLGLLPAPRVEGPKTHLFGSEHITRLREIRRLRGAGWPLSRIRKHFGSQALGERAGRRAELLPPDATRGRIVERATSMFAERGFDDLLGAVAHGRDAELAEKARSELHGMVTNVVPLLVRMIEAKRVRRIDPELLAYMLWYSLIGAGERMTLDSKLSPADVLEAYLEFVSFGTTERAK